MLTPERTQLIHSMAPMYRALYLGQRVKYLSLCDTVVKLNDVNILDHPDGCYLSLRSVKDLTEEEILKVAILMHRLVYSGDEYAIYHPKKYSKLWIDNVSEHGFRIYFSDSSRTEYFGLSSMPVCIADYLRGRSIALPYMGITVEEFIEAGTIVINPNQPV